MTRDEWDRGQEPEELLAWLRDQGASPRKLRLFAVACCRRIWPEPNAVESRQALRIAELYADGKADVEALQVAHRAAHLAAEAAWEAAGEPAVTLENASEVRFSYHMAEGAHAAAHAALDDAEAAACATARTAAFEAYTGDPTFDVLIEGERVGQCRLLREIINPFRPAHLYPAWLTKAVVRLAQAAYDTKAEPSGHLDPARLAILADSLEEGGCTDAELLTHLRGPGPHVRGCFALDAILQKG